MQVGNFLRGVSETRLYLEKHFENQKKFNFIGSCLSGNAEFRVFHGVVDVYNMYKAAKLVAYDAGV